MDDAPSVSLLVPNLNGVHHLERCFSSIAELDYPKDRLEVILADNGSRDESIPLTRSRFPWVRVLAFDSNLGYAAAMNRAASEARYDVLVFLNNDTRVERESLGHLVAPIARRRAAATSAKIVSWDGAEVHFAGGGTNFHGIAFQDGYGERDRPEFNEEQDTLFACGAASAVRRDLFHDAGGFDEDFFAYYEDVDLGWRLWVLGHRILYVPEAVVYHHHSATSFHVELYKLRVLHLRNPLYMLFKNYEWQNLVRVLPASLLLCNRRSWLLAGLDVSPFRVGDVPPMQKSRIPGLGRSRREFTESMDISKLVMSDLIAVHDITDRLPELIRKRDWIQERRRRSDLEILPLFRDPFRPAESDEGYARLQDSLCALFGIDELFATQSADKP